MKNLTLRQTVLALVTIPLLIQVALLLGFVSLQKDAEKQLQQVSQARAVLASLDEMEMSILHLLATYRSAKASEFGYLNLYKEMSVRSKDFDAQMYELKKLAPQDPEIEQMIKETEELRARTMRLARQYISTFGENLKGDESRTWMAQDLNDGLSQTASLLPRVSAKLRQYNEEDSEAKARMRNQQAWLMIGSAVIDLLLTIGVAIAILKSVQKRIQVISNNAERLAKGEELNPVAGGADELSHLDQVFHKMADDLRESARLRDDLIAMVSHDLKAPLMVIGNALAAMEETPPPLDPKKYLSIAHRNSKRAWSLVSDFLDREKALSGTLAVNRVKTSLNDLFVDCKETIEPIMGELDVKLEIAPSDLIVDADPESLTRILVNLVINAAKFSKEGSVVHVGADNKEGFARVWVKDEGVGMSPDELEHVFDRFHKGNARGRLEAGSGLGLAICKTLIELQGGKIWVESKPGAGSTFYFTLPLHALVERSKDAVESE